MTVHVFYDGHRMIMHALHTYKDEYSISGRELLTFLFGTLVKRNNKFSKNT